MMNDSPFTRLPYDVRCSVPLPSSLSYSSTAANVRLEVVILIAEAALCQPTTVLPEERRNPWCFATPPPPYHKSIRHQYRLLNSDGTHTLLGFKPTNPATVFATTTPFVLAAVSRYLRSLTPQLWNEFLSKNTFYFPTDDHLVRYFAAQPRWTLQYYRHILVRPDFHRESTQPREGRGGSRHARILLGLLRRDLRVTMELDWWVVRKGNELGNQTDDYPPHGVNWLMNWLMYNCRDVVLDTAPLKDWYGVENMPGYEVAVDLGCCQYFVLGRGALPPGLPRLAHLKTFPSMVEYLWALDGRLTQRRQFMLANPIPYHGSSEEEIREAYLASCLETSDLDPDEPPNSSGENIFYLSVLSMRHE
ncbi:hypothetical protein PG995_014453 [Apiospora arundinis]